MAACPGNAAVASGVGAMQADALVRAPRRTAATGPANGANFGYSHQGRPRSLCHEPQPRRAHEHVRCIPLGIWSADLGLACGRSAALGSSSLAQRSAYVAKNEVKDIRDKSLATAVYASQANDKHLAVKAAEVKKMRRPPSKCAARVALDAATRTGVCLGRSTHDSRPLPLSPIRNDHPRRLRARLSMRIARSVTLCASV